MFNLDEVLTILQNVGVDVSCGECCCVAFTGSGSGAKHTCKQNDPHADFLADVKKWEGDEVAKVTENFLYGKEGRAIAPSPFLALFNAKRLINNIN